MQHSEPADQPVAAPKSATSLISSPDNLIEWLLTLQSQVGALSEVLVERGIVISQEELDARAARVRRELFPNEGMNGRAVVGEVAAE